MEQLPIQSKETYINDINKAHRMAMAEDQYHNQIAILKNAPSGEADDYKINRLEYRAKRAGEKAGQNHDYDNDLNIDREEDSERAHRIAIAEKPYRDQMVAVEKEAGYFGLGTLRSLGRRAYDAGNLAAANHDADINQDMQRVDDVDKAYEMAMASRPAMEKVLKLKGKIEQVEDDRDSQMSYPRGFDLFTGSHKTLVKIPKLREKVDTLRTEASKKADDAGRRYDSSNS